MAAPAFIRRAEPRDYPEVLALARLVATTGDAFPWEGFDAATREDEDAQEAMLAEMWLPEPAHQREAFVCEVEDFTGIAGVYVLQPNGLGRCSHVAQGAYMVTPNLRGRGLGKQLCAHSLREAKRRQYKGMQFDMVVATNIAAIKAWTSCGFKTMCSLPCVFRHPDQGFVDAHVMFHDLEGVSIGFRKSVLSGLQQPMSARPAASSNYVVGDEVRIPLTLPPLEPSALASTAPSAARRFEVEPPLPDGLDICPMTGAIEGAPTQPCPETTYRITAHITSEATFQIADTARSSEASACINEDFAAMLDNVVDLHDMPKEPARVRAFGDWMIWMVHRAWLNDPTLIDFDFTNMHMPAPHLEERIAPKLVKAMHTNTHIEVLSLSNTDVHKSTAIELAEALGKNCTLKTLNLEGNYLDSNCVRELALSIGASPGSHLEHLRLSHQKQMGAFFGRPAEEAVGQMMQRNETIVKLGFECDDANWRNLIDRALLRNNDFSRRRSHAHSADVEEMPAEEKTLAQVKLHEIPASPPSEVFAEGSDRHSLLRSYMAQNLQLPTTSQLQHYAKNSGAPMSYTTAGPLIRECRAWLLDRAVASQVTVVDAFGVSSDGTFRAWQSNDERWTVELLDASACRLTFKALQEPAVFLSPAWSPWISRTKPSLAGA